MDGNKITKGTKEGKEIKNRNPGDAISGRWYRIIIYKIDTNKYQRYYKENEAKNNSRNKCRENFQKVE